MIQGRDGAGTGRVWGVGEGGPARQVEDYGAGRVRFGRVVNAVSSSQFKISIGKVG